eukprot:903455_1
MSTSNGFIFITIYSILVIQLIYFLISNLYYLYHNPQHRVFWAAFCIKQPINLPNLEISTCDFNTSSYPTISERPCTSSNTFAKYSSNLLTQSTGKTDQIPSKRKAFVHFGLETLSHCILVQLYLLCLLFLICLRLTIAYVTYRSTWTQYRVFCSYAFRLFSLKIIAHYCLQIIICIPALKIQYMYNSTKWQRTLPIVSIVFMIASIPIEMLKPMLTAFTVKDYQGQAICIHNGGIGMNPYLAGYIMFQYYLNFILCFATVITPLYVQRNMLINLPKNQPNDELLTLIKQINVLSKRVCLSAVIMIVSFVITNVFYWIFSLHPPKPPLLSIVTWLLYVEGYLAIVCIHKDWRIRLFPLCHYKYTSVCKCLRHATQRGGCTDVHQIGIELASSEKTSSIGVPNLVRDVSKDEIVDDTDTFSKDSIKGRLGY